MAGGPAPAETFHSRDGILFEGTIRLALSNAAVCNVPEDRYSETEYESLKDNHGRPLHLRRIDLSARNGSGRKLDFLRADSWVRSTWPPCVNWDAPEGFPEPYSWSDTLEVLGIPNGMRMGQKESRALYMLAFDGQQPRFGEWDINYTFASEANAADRQPEGRSGPAGQVAETGAVAGQLPPDILADLYLRQAVQAARDGDPAGARAATKRLQAAIRYLHLRGRDEEALDLIGRVESGKVDPVASEPFRPEPICAGHADGAQCWKELESHPGFYVWDTHYYPDQTVTWTGGCSDSLVSGTGTSKWIRGSEAFEASGLYRNGKATGHWVQRSSDGNTLEGSYMDGKAHGRWTLRFANGGVAEGPFVDGKRHGQWVVRSQSGRTETSTFVNSERQ